MSVKCRTLNNR